jgi:fatty acid-binding protein DegV
MVATKIIVDSACDLPDSIINSYDIETVPFNIHIDEKSYQDGINIKTEAVYAAILMKLDFFKKTNFS